MLVEALTAALICLDPGHGTPPAVGRQTEPIGPGSNVPQDQGRRWRERRGGGRARDREQDPHAAPSAGLPGRDDPDGARRFSLRERRQRRASPVLQPPGSRAHAPDPRGRLDGRLPTRASRPSTRPSIAAGPTTSTRSSLRAARVIQRSTVAATAHGISGWSSAATSPASTGRTSRRSWSRRGS